MKFNHCMHPRNFYKDNPPDFSLLADLYPEFKSYVKKRRSGKSFVNFHDPSAVRTLAKCLLQKDFGLSVLLPTNRLSPTIPSRLNYILWIEDLLNATALILKGQEKTTRHIIDIGTGSSCIYPLLGAQTDPGFKFTATEIDETNYENAVKNVESNHLNDRIDVVKVYPNTRTILSHLFESGKVTGNFDCCMCNPPFFSDVEDLKKSEFRPSAYSSCHVGVAEAITAGGDLRFAAGLFEESIKLKERVTWYTIMLGKKSSFLAMKKLISTSHESVLCTSYDFCQGNTVRWAIAWTYCAHLVDVTKLPESPLKIAGLAVKASRPIHFLTCEVYSLASCSERLTKHFDVLGVTYQSVSQSEECIKLRACAFEAKWLHTRQRARKRKREGVSVDSENAFQAHDSLSPVLECEVELAPDPSGKVNFSFKTQNRHQKDTLNGLVVHLKRLMTKSPS